MIYVMSDIHGEYDRYMKMLELIEFSHEDELYVLGDIADRGPEPVRIYKDMMSRDNVFPVMGNHDLMAYDVLRRLSVDITDENYSTQVDSAFMAQMMDWYADGGAVTMEAFRRLSKEERGDILDYISEFPLYETVTAGGKIFILVHGGLGNFRRDKKLKDYTAEELLLSRNDPDVRYFDDEDIFIVSGHTPVLKITGRPEIYKSAGNIWTDCGAVFGGRLGCLCLDTMEEFYV